MTPLRLRSTICVMAVIAACMSGCTDEGRADPCASGRCVDAGSSLDAGGGIDGGPRADAGGPSSCATPCSATQQCCGGACIDRMSPRGTEAREAPPFYNCGGCGVGCDPERAISCSVLSVVTNIVACVCGDEPQCEAHETCVADGSGHRCSDPASDPDNCGEIGHACSEGEICAGGECRCGGETACGAGSACCDGACVDTSSDATHCGGCGMACDAFGPSCNDGVCGCGSGRACRSPAGRDLGERCCADACVPVDDSNCAACGSACATGAMCMSGLDPSAPDGAGVLTTCCMGGAVSSHCPPT